jgi:hypothetical protein
MTRIGLLVGIAAIFVAAAEFASAGPPPLSLAVFAATGAQPVAGHSFAGLAIIPRSEYIFSVSCDARLGRKTLHARVLRYKAGGARPAAVTCSWRIPAGTQGKTLLISKESLTFTSGDEASGPKVVWTVKK